MIHECLLFARSEEVNLTAEVAGYNQLLSIVAKIQQALRACRSSTEKARGATLTKSTTFNEDAQGYERVRSLLGEPKGVLVAMEATGHYWQNLFAVLAGHGYAIALLNPLRTWPPNNDRATWPEDALRDAEELVLAHLPVDRIDARGGDANANLVRREGPARQLHEGEWNARLGRGLGFQRGTWVAPR